jgi:hypothetical protein
MPGSHSWPVYWPIVVRLGYFLVDGTVQFSNCWNRVANDASLLSAVNITRIVTVLSDPVEALPDVVYHHIAVSDSQGKGSEDLLRASLPGAVKFIG